MLLHRVVLPLMILWVLALSLATQVHAASHISGHHHSNSVCEWCQQHDNFSSVVTHSSVVPTPEASAIQNSPRYCNDVPLRNSYRYAIRAPPHP
ncbi:DUF2946 family protein [Ferrimonas lipolytica]|uniref:DUF2946 family protein n=1 Tax=Ferrimonas lipolytica TaxID=2724191 RepID=A0A6H1UK87_9GAMM|nr:DUF2946 family protein [Ferrimonas lipolytica]QIZ78636.1 DUF2946 family protein [Ferrimonas lipolytica]